MQNKVLNFSKISILFHSELIILMNTAEHGTAENFEIDGTEHDKDKHELFSCLQIKNDIQIFISSFIT